MRTQHPQMLAPNPFVPNRSLTCIGGSVRPSDCRPAEEQAGRETVQQPAAQPAAVTVRVVPNNTFGRAARTHLGAQPGWFVGACPAGGVYLVLPCVPPSSRRRLQHSSGQATTPTSHKACDPPVTRLLDSLSTRLGLQHACVQLCQVKGHVCHCLLEHQGQVHGTHAAHRQG